MYYFDGLSEEFLMLCLHPYTYLSVFRKVMHEKCYSKNPLAYRRVLQNYVNKAFHVKISFICIWMKLIFIIKTMSTL